MVKAKPLCPKLLPWLAGVGFLGLGGFAIRINDDFEHRNVYFSPDPIVEVNSDSYVGVKFNKTNYDFEILIKGITLNSYNQIRIHKTDEIFCIAKIGEIEENDIYWIDDFACNERGAYEIRMGDNYRDAEYTGNRTIRFKSNYNNSREYLEDVLFVMNPLDREGKFNSDIFWPPI